ncbi:SDR family oxidoreductase [Acanthopleuribacter pedis]|uniref:SDR family oxidoreductase n=1 Tax=Acanthopleuribacter pedis TaxID=442870 RepID=A0A8J7QMC3_9BACT|nr:SDR family NAD(P)-dependent oxidoreductase [Acanthopleuribacter pedis]MBO1320635.1 SDR family oxidoreductase [Acanthopleuribacter pedis]
MSFENKKVVVTGGTGAVGRAVCEAFLKAGADVYSSFVVDAELENLSPALSESDRFHTEKVDLTDERSVATWYANIGRPDVVANIAGGFSMGPFAEISSEDWQKMQAVNLTTCFLSCREALRKMDPNGHGRIINVAAWAAVGRTGGMAAYTTAKSGVISLTEALAEETLLQKITVNAVLPTIMDTPANREAMPDADFDAWVPTANVAETILFLSGESAWHITGAAVPLRGHL